MHPEYDDEQFLFDDFFVAQDATDPGDKVSVEIRGRQVPVFLKRGLSFSDREAAKNAAVQTRVKPNGQVEIVRMDEGVFAVELLYRCLVSWPFTYKSGKKVEISRENIQAMLADGAEALAMVVVKRMQSRQEKLEPFTKPSEQTSADLS